MADWPRKCGHCGGNLMKSAYHEHKKHYYDKESCEWATTDQLTTLERYLSQAKDVYNELLHDHSTHREASERLTQLLLEIDAVTSRNSQIKNIRKRAVSEILVFLEEIDQQISQEEAPGIVEDMSSTHSGSDSESTDAYFEHSTDESETEIWSDEDINFNDINDTTNMNTEEAEETLNAPDVTIFIAGFLIFLLGWQATYKISCACLLSLWNGIMVLLSQIAVVFKLDMLHHLVSKLPRSLNGIKSQAKIKQDDFEVKVSCPRCDRTYSYDECYNVTSTGTKKSLKCGYQYFPNHPRAIYRKQCGAFLLKTVRSVNGKDHLYPKRTFCYRKLSESIREMSVLPNFAQKCQAWRRRPVNHEKLCDIYDGDIWKNMHFYFNKAGITLGLLMNVDWFQPFKHTPYSVGVVSFTLMNLPINERNKPENRVIHSIIPGPKEPKTVMNSYMKELVDELLTLKDGIFIKDNMGGNIYNMVLLGMSSDIPATRKACGFVGHGAYKGCSKCDRSFPRKSFHDKCDYSGFDNNSDPRTMDAHRTEGENWLKATTQSARNIIERKFGIRYTELLRLPYFDSAKCHAVDPMHNLLLGTAKHVTQYWISNGILSHKNLEEIQEKMDEINVPSDVGRIPSKIESNFSGFTSDQWKNWVLIYSLLCLKGVICDQRYAIWSLFVKSCKTLLSKEISFQDLAQAHNQLILFCKKFSELNGSTSCTMNMHLHMHIKDCIDNFGPVYGFWCYSFERMNGILGSYPTNNHSIEVQIMRRFCESRQLHFKNNISEYDDILSKCNKQRGTVEENYNSLNSNELLPPATVISIPNDEKDHMKLMLKYQYPCEEVLEVKFLGTNHRRAVFRGKLIGIESGRLNRSSAVCSRWFKMVNGLPVFSEIITENVGTVLKLYEVIFVVESSSKRILKKMPIAKVEWYKQHTEESYFASPVIVCSPDVEEMGPASFIPLHNIQNRCVITKQRVKFLHGYDNAVLAMPLNY